MSQGKVSVDKRGHVFLIGLDRAQKRNAFDVAMYHALSRAYAKLSREDDLRAAVLFAHGDHFTAGLDLAELSPVFASGTFDDVVDLGSGILAAGGHQGAFAGTLGPCSRLPPRAHSQARVGSRAQLQKPFEHVCPCPEQSVHAPPPLPHA